MWAAGMRRNAIRVLSIFGIASLFQNVVVGTLVDPTVLDSCPGYSATDVKDDGTRLTADLVLNGKGCNVFGSDIQKLTLDVVYETDNRIHVKITDPTVARYEVPESLLPRPQTDETVSQHSAAIQFNFTTAPFSFSIYRTSTSEVLFSTASYPIIFEPQYLRVKTTLPKDANIYGLGEHSNSFRLPPQNTTLTLWSRDAYGTPAGTNLYGNHPVYFEHRSTGTHGVFLLNSNGMDIKLTDGALEYNVIGGVLDFYFLAGSTSDPIAVARQYAEIVGTPAEVPYWSLGFHQCRFGYRDFVDVANVITNYSTADIPLETMWTDIDYMFKRRVFTVDPQYFPLNRMREIVSYLHSHDQQYVLMTDPAVAYGPGENYGPYDRGTAADIWLKAEDGSVSFGVVWPGVTVYPDWFHPKTQEYWNNEFQLFNNPKDGIDIDGSWIDMNEPASFCNFPCTDPFQQATEQNLPPPRTSLPPDPNAPIFSQSSSISRRDDVLNPPYTINNAAGGLSNKTAPTNVKHANGLIEYDVHNVYGEMMSVATHNALLNRRPGKRTFVITRSTFAGAGKHVGKWLGDNLSMWDHYRISISGILGFASVYQVPMVGADICGFGGDTTEHLCARWATLGAFYPFMRNHNQDIAAPQEFYRWESVTQAAQNAIDARYRLLDYIYTSFHQANTDGTPILQPLWFNYPKDQATYSIDLQFFYGNSILVSPVTDEDSTSVSIYLPRDIFYDFNTLAPVYGTGANLTLDNVPFTEIPLHIRGGSILPLRVQSAKTTRELRTRNFEFVVAPDTDGIAEGQLYIDDGVSINQPQKTQVRMSYKRGVLTVNGEFGFQTGVKASRVRFLGVTEAPTMVEVNAKVISHNQVLYDGQHQVVDVEVGLDFTMGFKVQIC